MEYPLLKVIHIACAALSWLGFFVRGIWKMRDSPVLARRWVRIVPHVNDTVLLASAIALAVMSRRYLFHEGWLTAKLIALAIYIALGLIALRPGRGRTASVLAWIAAQLVFVYIVAVALTRNPLVLL